MRLWDEELEGYREEARAMLQHMPALAQFSGEMDAVERAEAARKAFDESMPPALSEKAECRAIPGPAGDLPVRIFRPKGEARGLFLHLHGGGWILGNRINISPTISIWRS